MSCKDTHSFFQKAVADETSQVVHGYDHAVAVRGVVLRRGWDVFVLL